MCRQSENSGLPPKTVGSAIADRAFGYVEADDISEPTLCASTQHEYRVTIRSGASVPALQWCNAAGRVVRSGDVLPVR